MEKEGKKKKMAGWMSSRRVVCGFWKVLEEFCKQENRTAQDVRIHRSSSPQRHLARPQRLGHLALHMSCQPRPLVVCVQRQDVDCLAIDQRREPVRCRQEGFERPLAHCAGLPVDARRKIRSLGFLGQDLETLEGVRR